MTENIMVSVFDMRRIMAMAKANFMQNFAEAVQGKQIVYLYRVMGDENAASALAFTTENGRTVSKDADSTATKDGSIRTPGVAEVEITATSILSKGDTMINALQEAMEADKLIEVWEANLADTVTAGLPGGQTGYKGRYFQGYLTELEITSNAEDMAEVSLTFGINGGGKTGTVTVTTEQAETASYVFTDTVAKS